MSYVLSKKTVSTAKGVGVSSEKYPKLHLVDVMSDTLYPIPPPPPPTGGVGILLKNKLLEGVEFIKRVDCSDYLICKLKKHFFRQAKDIYLIIAYIRPYNSSLGTENNNGKELLEEIGRIINELKEEGEVILCSDLNSIIGQRAGMIKHDSSNFLPMPDDYEPD